MAIMTIKRWDMTNREKIQDYQERIEKLKQQKQIIGIPADLKWGDKYCPYCGKEREPLQQVFGDFGTSYAICKCDEAQAELERTKKIAFALEDMDRNIEVYQDLIDKERKRAEKLIKKSLGRRFSDRTFETFKVNADNKEAYKKCFEYVNEFGKNKGMGIILSGSVGTGKTHLAAAITHKIIEEYGIPVQFKTAIEIYSELTDFSKETADKYKKCDLLVVDDIGKEKSTDWKSEKLFEIINARYEDYLPTIFTTNLPPNKLKELFGDAVFSRVVETCEYIPLKGIDWRTK